MAHRPILVKKLNRLRKSMHVSPPAFMDLVAWLKDHRHAQTTGAAHRLILAGKVRHGSHKVGIRYEEALDANGEIDRIPVVYPYLPSEWRSELIVLGP